MPAGRPTDYKPEYCKLAKEFLADGYSLTALAGKIGISKVTIYNWYEKFPEFMNAVKEGQAAAVLWWEDRARDLAITGQGNATAVVFGLKNRAADEWRDMKTTELTGPNGGPIETNVKRIERVVIDPKNTDAS